MCGYVARRARPGDSTVAPHVRWWQYYEISAHHDVLHAHGFSLQSTTTRGCESSQQSPSEAPARTHWAR